MQPEFEVPAGLVIWKSYRLFVWYYLELGHALQWSRFFTQNFRASTPTVVSYFVLVQFITVLIHNYGSRRLFSPLVATPTLKLTDYNGSTSDVSRFNLIGDLYPPDKPLIYWL
jgi:hypothetical protein